MSTRTGSCHCGAVRYEVELERVDRAVACNCSICRRTGNWMAFVPRSAFTLLSGEGALRDYQFGPKHIHHLFCGTCGIRSFGRGVGPDGSEMIAINLRCVDGVDVRAVELQWYDGAAL